MERAGKQGNNGLKEGIVLWNIIGVLFICKEQFCAFIIALTQALRSSLPQLWCRWIIIIIIKDLKKHGGSGHRGTEGWQSGVPYYQHHQII